MTGQGLTYCSLCDEFIANGYGVPWGRSPWGDGDDWAHYRCAHNYEPSDEEMCPSEWGPTLQERQEAARRLK